MRTEICFTWKEYYLILFYCLFFTPVPLIVGRWYIHQITRKWCFGSQGGLDKSSFGTFNLSHANLKKCLNLIKINKTFIISIKGDDGRLPVDHPGGHGDEDEDRAEGQPTPPSRKQHRLEPLIRCTFYRNLHDHTWVFACISNFKSYLQLRYDRENLSFANINPLSNTFIEQ